MNISDFVSFAKQLKVTDKCGGQFFVNPSPALLAYEAKRSSRDIVKKPRQIGMTTWELARDIWYAATHQDADVVVLVLHEAAADNVVHQVRDLLRATYMTGGMRTQPIASDKCTSNRFNFVNGSRLTVMPIFNKGLERIERGRGRTVHRLHVSEAAFFPQGVSDQVVCTMFDSVPERGEIVIESSVPEDNRPSIFTEIWNGTLRGSSWQALVVD